MVNDSKDPLGHVKLSVSKFGKSKTFYTNLFKILGFRQIADYNTSAGWRTAEGFGIWIAEAQSPVPRYKFSAPGFHHLCFKAISTKQVDKVYNSVKNKTKIFNNPKKYPQYNKRYYAVFFADPDGMKLEVAYY